MTQSSNFPNRFSLNIGNVHTSTFSLTNASRTQSHTLLVLSSCFLGSNPCMSATSSSWDQHCQEEVTDIEDLEARLITIRDVYFIHQSAKDYLNGNASALIFPAGYSKIHYDMFSQSLDALSKSLRQDMYNLQDPKNTTKNVPNPNPLTSIKYSCIFWVDHLSFEWLELGPAFDDGAIFSFLKEHFLHWLESLSLISKLSDGVLSIKT